MPSVIALGELIYRLPMETIECIERAELRPKLSPTFVGISGLKTPESKVNKRVIIMDDKYLLKRFEGFGDETFSNMFGRKAAIMSCLIALDDKEFEEFIIEVRKRRKQKRIVKDEVVKIPYTHKVDEKAPIKFFDDKVKKEIIEELKRVKNESEEDFGT